MIHFMYKLKGVDRMKILEICGWCDTDATNFYGMTIGEGINLVKKFGHLEKGTYLLWEDEKKTITKADEQIEEFQYVECIEFKVYEKNITPTCLAFLKEELDDGVAKDYHDITIVETKTRDEVFTLGKKGHMSFEELIIMSSQEVIDRLLLTDRFKVDKCFDFEIKINGINVCLETLKKYIEKKFVNEFEGMKKERAELKERKKDLSDEICDKAKYLVKEKIEEMFRGMSNNIQEIEEKLIENNRSCLYHWDEEYHKNKVEKA